MDSSGFDSSIIFVIVLAAGFLAMIIATIVRMSKKKAGGGRSTLSTRDEDEDEVPARGGRDRRGVQEAPHKADDHHPPAKQPAAVKGGKAPAPVPAEVKAAAAFKAEVGRARHMSEGLARTRREGFVSRLADTFRRGGEIDESLIAGAEESLLTADLGVRTATELTEGLRSEFRPAGGELLPQVMDFLRTRTLTMLEGQAHGLPALDENGVNVVMVVGVNGTGKTTNIAKLANWYAGQGKKVLLAAGDTYRAAGADQLGIWGERIGIPVVVGRPGQDPSSLFFDAARRAVDEGFNVLIADTAGRLHTDVNLVDELKKIHRVFGKAIPGAPHQVLLMLDATMGQNAVRQADVFLKSVKVTGIGLSKLDGTAKGGVVVSIARDMNLPIWFVGVGEAVTDIRSFVPAEFVDALYAVE